MDLEAMGDTEIIVDCETAVFIEVVSVRKLVFKVLVAV